MRAIIQADIVCDKARLFAKSAEQVAKTECDATIRELSLRLAHSRIIELEEKLAQMSQLAHEDQLTGILNRRGCDSAFTRELSRCRRSNAPLSLAALDIDDFKRINDEYGHAAGDAALVHFTKIISANIRTSDIFARTGGEEFLIILPDTRIEHAALTVARLQKAMSLARLQTGQTSLELTFSVGIARLQPCDTAEGLIERADFGTRTAKKNGKNCMVCT